MVKKVFKGALMRLKSFQKEWMLELWSYKYSILFSLIFIVVAVIVSGLSSSYVTYSIQTAQVPDLILDNIGPFDWSFSFVYISLFLFYSLFIYPIFFYVPRIHRVCIQFSLLLVIRSFFLIFTHLQTPLDA